jgi:putative inorganic carbon (hco3(-)) transporter
MVGENTSNSFEKSIFIGFLILIAWVPLPFGSKYAWAWPLLEIWVYVLSSAWLLALICNKVNFTGPFLKARPVIFIFILWLLWILFQITPLPAGWVSVLSPQAAALYAGTPTAPHDWLTLSVDVFATKQGLLKSLAYVLVFCLALLLVRSRRRVRLFAYVLILSGLFQAVYGSLMTLSGLEYSFFVEKIYGRGHATGTFTNRNHLAGYLEMCLAVGIGIMIASLDAGNRHYSGQQLLRKLLQLILSPKARLRLFLVIMVIALVLTHSRMGNTAFFASMLIAGGIGLLLSRHATRSTVILLVSLIVIDIFIVGTWFGIEKVAERLEQTSFVAENRDEVYQHILDQLEDYQLTGSGLGSFYAVFPKYRKQDVGGYYIHAHNDYLEFATETGLVGITLLGLAVISSFIVAVIAQYRRRDPIMRGLSFAAIMGICAIMIHSTVDFNLQIPANAITFMLLLAMAWIALGHKAKRKVVNNEDVWVNNKYWT